MRNVLILLALTFVAIKGFLVYASMNDAPRAHVASHAAVIVYGRNACGYTSRMRKYLSEHGVRYEYRIVDEPAVADQLHAQMREEGMNIKRYDLPVVDVDGDLFIRPDPERVLSDYRS